jgi:hypothetical protein
LPRLAWQTALKALAGFLAGLIVYTFLSGAYGAMVAKLTEAAIHIGERPDVTRLVPEGDYVSIDRRDFDPRSKRPSVPVSDLTFNFLILTALFAADARTFSDRNIAGFAIACVAIIPFHAFALLTEVMTIYTAKLGPWSMNHYGPTSRMFWSVANHAYRLVLMYAIAFGLWWGLRPRGEAVVAKRSRAKTQRRGRSR